MDVVIAYISPKFCMILSRSWEKRVGGTLQMDFSYATILVLGGQYRRIYREVKLAYLVSDNKNPTNYLIYSVQEDFGSCMLHLNDDCEVFYKSRKIIMFNPKQKFKMMYGKRILLVHHVRKEKEQALCLFHLEERLFL